MDQGRKIKNNTIRVHHHTPKYLADSFWSLENIYSLPWPLKYGYYSYGQTLLCLAKVLEIGRNVLNLWPNLNCKHGPGPSPHGSGVHAHLVFTLSLINGTTTITLLFTRKIFIIIIILTATWCNLELVLIHLTNFYNSK